VRCQILQFTALIEVQVFQGCAGSKRCEISRLVQSVQEFLAAGTSIRDMIPRSSPHPYHLSKNNITMGYCPPDPSPLSSFRRSPHHDHIMSKLLKMCFSPIYR
jgi:hypothetical protein